MWTKSLTRRHQYLLIVISAAVCFLAIFWSDFAHLIPSEKPTHFKEFHFPRALNNPEINYSGWRAIPDGLTLHSSGMGTLQLHLSREPKHNFFIEVVLEGLEQVNTSLSVEIDGQPMEVNSSMIGQEPVNLSPMLYDAREFKLQLTVEKLKKTGRPGGVLLTKIIILEQQPLFPLPLAAYTLGCFAVLIYLLRTLLPTRSESAINFSFAVIGWTFIHFQIPEALDFFTPHISFILLGLLIFCWVRNGELKKNRKQVELLLGIFILILAINARWDTLQMLQVRPLDPDPETYLKLAIESQYFIDTGKREPFYPFCLKIGTTLFGKTILGVRMTTLFLSLVVVGLCWRVGREVFSVPVGLLSALLMALHRNFIYINVRGYRLEIYSVLLLLFFWFCFGRRHWSLKRRSIALGITGAFICLTRLNSYSAIVMMVACLFLKKQWSMRYIALIIVLPLITLGPSFAYWINKYQDPMVAVNTHLKYYRNIEFVDHPAIPKGDDPYRGPCTNTLKYFFTEWHTPGQTIINIGAGLVEIFIGDYGWRYIFQGSGLLICLSLVGLARWAFTSSWPMLFWLFLMTAPLAFFQSISLDFRLIMHILPFLGFSAGDALQSLFSVWNNHSSQK